MLLILRHMGRFVVDVALFTIRSGRWWLPVSVVLLIVAAALATATEVVVPVVTYTLF